MQKKLTSVAKLIFKKYRLEMFQLLFIGNVQDFEWRLSPYITVWYTVESYFWEQQLLNLEQNKFVQLRFSSLKGSILF